MRTHTITCNYKCAHTPRLRCGSLQLLLERCHRLHGIAVLALDGLDAAIALTQLRQQCRVFNGVLLQFLVQGRQLFLRGGKNRS